MIEDWLLQPIIEKTEQRLSHKQGGDAAVRVRIVVPGFGHFFVMRPVEGEVRPDFVDSICQYLYGAVHEWYEE